MRTLFVCDACENSLSNLRGYIDAQEVRLQQGEAQDSSGPQAENSTELNSTPEQ